MVLKLFDDTIVLAATLQKVAIIAFLVLGGAALVGSVVMYRLAWRLREGAPLRLAINENAPLLVGSSESGTFPYATSREYD